MLHEHLPRALQVWVEELARAIGLPGPDDYVVLLLRLEKQRLELEAIVSFDQSIVGDPRPSP